MVSARESGSSGLGLNPSWGRFLRYILGQVTVFHSVSRRFYACGTGKGGTAVD